MSRRRKLTRLQRVSIYDAAKGVCCLCQLPIQAERGQRWILEHLKPLWLGGADDDTNVAPAHERCAIDKTTREAPVKAKGDRVRARHLGVKKPRSITQWRKMDGTIVHASRER
jgi:5-methylcytosine-specific restriction endonuclease McrA